MRPARALIDLNALRQNYRLARELSAGAKALAVVKADAYGHGAIRCASFQFDSGVRRRSLLDGDYKELSMTSRHAITAATSPLLHSAHLIGCSSDKPLRKASS